MNGKHINIQILNKKKLSKKVFCILMSACLVMLMIPAGLRAHAINQSTEANEQTGLNVETNEQTNNNEPETETTKVSQNEESLNEDASSANIANIEDNTVEEAYNDTESKDNFNDKQHVIEINSLISAYADNTSKINSEHANCMSLISDNYATKYINAASDFADKALNVLETVTEKEPGITEKIEDISYRLNLLNDEFKDITDTTRNGQVYYKDIHPRYDEADKEFKDICDEELKTLHDVDIKEINDLVNNLDKEYGDLKSNSKKSYTDTKSECNKSDEKCDNLANLAYNTIKNKIDTYAKEKSLTQTEAKKLLNSLEETSKGPINAYKDFCDEIPTALKTAKTSVDEAIDNAEEHLSSAKDLMNDINESYKNYCDELANDVAESADDAETYTESLNVLEQQLNKYADEVGTKDTKGLAKDVVDLLKIVNDNNVKAQSIQKEVDNRVIDITEKLDKAIDTRDNLKEELNSIKNSINELKELSKDGSKEAKEKFNQKKKEICDKLESIPAKTDEEIKFVNTFKDDIKDLYDYIAKQQDTIDKMKDDMYAEIFKNKTLSGLMKTQSDLIRDDAVNVVFYKGSNPILIQNLDKVDVILNTAISELAKCNQMVDKWTAQPSVPMPENLDSLINDFKQIQDESKSLLEETKAIDYNPNPEPITPANTVNNSSPQTSDLMLSVISGLSILLLIATGYIYTRKKKFN